MWHNLGEREGARTRLTLHIRGHSDYPDHFRVSMLGNRIFRFDTCSYESKGSTLFMLRFFILTEIPIELLTRLYSTFQRSNCKIYDFISNYYNI